MKRIGLIAGVALAAAACSGGPKEIPPLEAKFVTNDCDLVAAVARDNYKLTRTDPPMRAMMVGEDLDWRPACNYQAMGFNLVEVYGPEGVAANPNMGEVTFYRPKYDNDGAELRTAISRQAGTTERALCRLARTGNTWSVATCGADPRETQPRAPLPSPADVTPDSKLPAPGSRTLPRDATIPEPDPGAPTP